MYFGPGRAESSQTLSHALQPWDWGSRCVISQIWYPDGVLGGRYALYSTGSCFQHIGSDAEDAPILLQAFLFTKPHHLAPFPGIGSIFVSVNSKSRRGVRYMISYVESIHLLRCKPKRLVYMYEGRGLYTCKITVSMESNVGAISSSNLSWPRYSLVTAMAMRRYRSDY